MVMGITAINHVSGAAPSIVFDVWGLSYTPFYPGNVSELIHGVISNYQVFWFYHLWSG